MTQTARQLEEVVETIRALETSLKETPTVETANRLQGAQRVASVLTERVATERAEREEAERREHVQRLQEEYAVKAESLERLYDGVAAALRAAVEGIKPALDLRNELRGLRNEIESHDGLAPRMPENFWPRDRKLLDDFRDSVLTRGEP